MLTQTLLGPLWETHGEQLLGPLPRPYSWFSAVRPQLVGQA